MKEEKIITVIVNAGTKPYFYRGKIQSEDDQFLKFVDEKIGLISINRDAIISIQHEDLGASR